MRRLASAVALLGLLATPARSAVGDQIDKLTANDAASDDWFGVYVAADRDAVIVGAYRDDVAGADSGSAYVFDATSGDQTNKLEPADGSSGDRVGTSVALQGDTALIGSPRDGAGSAYVFNTQSGDELRKLTPNDGVSNDEFGYSVAIDGGLALVGSRRDDPRGTDSGSAYLFDASTGQQIDKLVPNDGSAFEQFGFSVALDGTHALVGAYLDSPRGGQSGSVYVFDSSSGQQLRKLIPSDGAGGDLFGFSVAIEGDTALIGAIFAAEGGRDSGAAYLFDIPSGQQLDKLTPDDGASGDSFGWSVALDGGVALVGALEDDGATGSAYLFDVETGSQIAKLTADDRASGDSFGNSVALSRGVAVVGALRDGSDVGAAYLFEAAEPLEPGDFNGDGLVNQSDYETWRDSFGAAVAAGSGADANGDGVVDAADYTVWRDARAESTAVSVPEPTSFLMASALSSLVSGRGVRRCRGTAGYGRAPDRPLA